MTREEKHREVARLKNYDVCVAKERLSEVAMNLEEIGAIREAKSLMTIVYRLEEWQNK